MISALLFRIHGDKKNSGPQHDMESTGMRVIRYYYVNYSK